MGCRNSYRPFDNFKWEIKVLSRWFEFFRAMVGFVRRNSFDRRNYQLNAMGQIRLWFCFFRMVAVRTSFVLYLRISAWTRNRILSRKRAEKQRAENENTECLHMPGMNGVSAVKDILVGIMPSAFSHSDPLGVVPAQKLIVILYLCRKI